MYRGSKENSKKEDINIVKVGGEVNIIEVEVIEAGKVAKREREER